MDQTTNKNNILQKKKKLFHNNMICSNIYGSSRSFLKVYCLTGSVNIRRNIETLLCSTSSGQVVLLPMRTDV